MKSIQFFFVAAVLLLSRTASADLTVYEYVAGEKVTLDTVTGNYWYWDLADFASMSYDEQIAVIVPLGTYGDIAGGWHMASYPEMSQLWAYSESTITSKFGGPSSVLGWAFNSVGRYESSYIITTHYLAGRLSGDWTDLEVWSGMDADFPAFFGAWVTTDASVVPAPGALTLAAFGLLTVGAKLRRRKR